MFSERKQDAEQSLISLNTKNAVSITNLILQSQMELMLMRRMFALILNITVNIEFMLDAVTTVTIPLFDTQLNTTSKIASNLKKSYEDEARG